jgi:hypothetical protein
MSEDERAATERQRLVLVHDVESPVKNLAAGEEPARVSHEDAPIDLSALEAPRFPAQIPVTSSTDGHRTAAYATAEAVELLPRQVTTPPPDSSIVVEPTVLDEPPPPPDPSRLAPTVRRREVPDPKRDAETVPDGKKLFSQKRAHWLIASGGTIALLLFIVIVKLAARGQDRRPPAAAGQIAAPVREPSLSIPPVPSDVPEVEPVQSAPSASPPKCVGNSTSVVNAPVRQPPPATVDDNAHRSRSTKRNFVE